MSITNESAGRTLLPNQPEASSPESTQPLSADTTRADMRFTALWGWLYPRRAAGRTWNGALLRAWIWHIVAGLLTFFALSIIISWYAENDPFELLGEIGAECAREFQHDRLEFFLVIAIIIGSIEGGVLALACIIMPWGCQDEPLGKSFASAFRQTWLHTTHVLPAMLIILLPAAMYDSWQNSYRHIHGSAYESAQTAIRKYELENPRPPTPVLPPNASAAEIQTFKNEMQGWNQKAQEVQRRRQLQASRIYAQARRDYYTRQPFLLRYGQEIIVVLAGLVTFRFVWSLIRAIATPRPEPPIRRDPMCEFCGYNLIATPADSRCPECGQPVVDSLGEHVRNGPPWEHRAEIGRWPAWWKTTRLAIFQPRAFGRMLPVRRPLTGHGIVLTAYLLIAFVAGLAMGIIMSLMHQQRLAEQGFYFYRTEMYLEILFGMGVTVLTTAGVIGLWAWLVTLFARWQTGRNLGRVALVHAVYASVLPIAWGLVFGVLLVVMNSSLGPKILRLLRNPYIDSDLLAAGLVFIPCLIVLVKYCACVVRGTLAARWANR